MAENDAATRKSGAGKNGVSFRDKIAEGVLLAMVRQHLTQKAASASYALPYVPNIIDGERFGRDAAKIACQVADAMLAAREK